MEVAELAGIPFFAQLTAEERERLAPCAKREVVPAGLVITVFGERGDEFYVIEAGQAYVSQDSGRLAELGPGDFFGEIALVEPGWRTASVQAATSMHLIVLTEGSCGALLRENPSLAERLYAAASERLARAES
jgi:voltage-gated potassium channel